MCHVQSLVYYSIGKEQILHPWHLALGLRRMITFVKPSSCNHTNTSMYTSKCGSWGLRFCQDYDISKLTRNKMNLFFQSLECRWNCNCLLSLRCLKAMQTAMVWSAMNWSTKFSLATSASYQWTGPGKDALEFAWSFTAARIVSKSWKASFTRQFFS